MPFFILQHPEEMANRSPYLNAAGKAECVEFVRKATCAPHTSHWREGKKVQGNELSIPRGTAIATFVDGKYESRKTGNHAAIFLYKGASGIWVMDQYHKKFKVSKREIRYKSEKEISSEKKAGTYKLSNDAAAYSVIEVHEVDKLSCG